MVQETKRGKRGWGRGRKELLAKNPPVFENLCLPMNALADWLVLQVLMWLINICVTCGQIDNIAQLVMASLFDEGDFEDAGTLPGIVLKTEQKHAIKQLFFCGVLLALLPAAFAKSLVVQLLGLVAKRLTQKKCSVLVVCTLKSMVEDQINEAENFRISVKLG